MSALSLSNTACFVFISRDTSDLDTAPEPSDYTVTVSIPGVAQQSGAPDFGSRVAPVEGVACATAESVHFGWDDGLRTRLVLGAQGGRVEQVENDIPPALYVSLIYPYDALRTGIARVVESSDDGLEVHIHDARFCNIEDVECPVLAEPIVITVDGPTVAADPDAPTTQDPRWFHLESGERLCALRDLL